MKHIQYNALCRNPILAHQLNFSHTFWRAKVAQYEGQPFGKGTWTKQKQVCRRGWVWKWGQVARLKTLRTDWTFPLSKHATSTQSPYSMSISSILRMHAICKCGGDGLAKVWGKQWIMAQPTRKKFQYGNLILGFW
jgi:hypothetical protein